MFTLALLLALAAPGDGLTDQIAHCGIARDQISVRHEEVLQDDVATIATPAAALTAPQLKCLAALSISGRIFAFTDPAAQKRFDPVVEREIRKAAVAEARQWLTDRNLLDRLPVYDPKRQSLAEFGLALEALCGIPAGTGIKAAGANQLTIVPPNDLNMDDATVARFQCIVSAGIAADPEMRSFTLGFTGNGQLNE